MDYRLIKADLDFIYGVDVSDKMLSLLKEKINDFVKNNGGNDGKRAAFSEKDVVLITYGDNVREEGKPGIQVFG